MGMAHLGEGGGGDHLHVFPVGSPNAIHDKLGARTQLQIALVAVDAAFIQHLLDLLPRDVPAAGALPSA